MTTDTPGALPPWLMASDAFLKAAKEIQPNTSPASQSMTPLEWLQQGAKSGVDSLDPRLGLRPEHRTSMAVRLTSTHPHAAPEVWAAFLRDAAKTETWKWYGLPTCPEDEKARLKNLTAEELLEDANKNGGKK